MLTGRRYARDQELINLTLSDDDTSRQDRPRALSNLSASAAQMLEDLPVSNHGLMLPATYDSNSENRSRNGYSSYEDGPGFVSARPSTGAASSSNPPRQPRAPSRLPTAQSHTPKAHLNGDGLYEENGLQYLAAGPYSADSVNARPLRASGAQAKPSSSRAHTRGAVSHRRRELSMGNANRSGVVSVENSAKRRKTHGGISSGEGIRSTPGADSRDRAHLHTAPQQAASSPQVVSMPNANDGGDRSRRAGHIPVASPSQATLHNEKINLMLKKQVFPHIKSAVQLYQKKLSERDRREVGEMVSTAFFLTCQLKNTNHFLDSRNPSK
jgi:hypothetical protein